MISQEEINDRFLLQEEYLGLNKSVNKILPVVSVRVNTYQHINYIKECLDSILMQKTNFDFEIIIGEDGSSDNTQQICIEYAEKHPDKIRLFLRDRRLTAIYDEQGKLKKTLNSTFTIKSCRGKYFAVCEGDDYWTDPYKFQKQVDFLEANPSYSFCFHEVEIINEIDNSKRFFNNIKEKKVFSIQNLTQGNFIATGSVVFRNDQFVIPADFLKLEAGDWGLHVLNAQRGDFVYLPDCMGVYRIHSNGFWASQNIQTQVLKSINIMTNLNKLTKFKYNADFLKGIEAHIQIHKIDVNTLATYANLLSDDAFVIAGRCVLNNGVINSKILEKNEPPKKVARDLVMLNLGCGNKFHEKWQNFDFKSNSPFVKACNLNLGIPLSDNACDVVYHSHVLEHFSKQKAIDFIRECYRVLKPGGIIRIAAPDLEKIAEEYLKNLRDAITGNKDAAERYDWMMLEMYDQTVRNVSGGEMLKYWLKEPLPQKDFIVKRMGSEVKNVISNLAGNRNYFKNLQLEESLSDTQIGKFRRDGEVHQWMYDRFSLSRLLQNLGFKNMRVCRADESVIPDFNNYLLDIESDGQVRKPDSFFMEAEK